MMRKFSIDTGMGQPILAKRFMQLVGPRIFGTAWSDADIRSLLDPEGKLEIMTLFMGNSEDPAHRRFFVQARILDMLAAEEIVAAVDIPKPNWEKICVDAWSGDPDFENYFSALSPEQWGAMNAQKIVEHKHGRTGRLLASIDDEDESDDEVSSDIEFAQNFDRVRPYFQALKSLKSLSVTATVTGAYWAELIGEGSVPFIDSRLDWVGSRLMVPAKYLDFDYSHPTVSQASPLIVRKAPLGQNEPQQSKAAVMEKIARKALEGYLDRMLGKYQLKIQNPAEAVKRVAQQPHYIDNTGWGQQFMEGERHYWPLVIAATWRVIALKLKKKEISLTENHPEYGVQAKIRKDLLDYLDAQTADVHERPSENSLKKIIKGICNQFYGQEHEANIFFNLTDAGLMMQREKPAKE